MKRLAVMVGIVALAGEAGAETNFEAGRRAYAVMKAGAEYCPDIEETWTASAMIRGGYGYDPLIDGAELDRLQNQKDRLFETFRGVPRVLVCEMLMHKFGPGGQLHLFQFR